MGLHFSVISGVEHSSIFRSDFDIARIEHHSTWEKEKNLDSPRTLCSLVLLPQFPKLLPLQLKESSFLSKIKKNEGLVSFWRGNMANVIRYFPTQALNFAFKDTVKALFKTAKDAPQYEKFGKNILSGGCAGSMSLFFVYSLDYCRTRLANDAKTKTGTRQYNGMIDVYTKTIKSDGIQGLYRGFVISCVGIFIYRGMYFGLYDSIKPIVLGDNASVFLSFILGWIVTVTAGLMSYPIDTIRRRMMMTSGAAVKYKN